MKKTLFTLISFAIISPAFAAGDNGPENSLSFRQLLSRVAVSNSSLALPEPEAIVIKDDLALLADDRSWVTVGAADKFKRTRLLELGLDIVEVDKDSVRGFARESAVREIAAKGFRIDDKISIYNFDKDFPTADAVYHNFQETIDLLRQLAAAHPDETSLFSIGKTVEGRDIWALRINPAEKGETPSDRPGAVFMANHHAREHLTNEVALLFAVWLLENKNAPEARKYIDTLDIHIIPMVNPDGAEYDISTGKYKWWRKNRSVNPGGTYGVDLNRNYDARWCEAGASTSPSADTYCGPRAFSEPETRAIRDFVLARPNIKTLLSYHTYSELILYPWAGSAEPLENKTDLKVFEAMAKQFAVHTGYVPQQSSDLYVATGDTTDWAYMARNIFAFTFELTPKRWGGGGFYPGAGVIEKVVADNIKAAMYMLSVTDDPYKLAR
ncbi:MAG TPA: carboxypeptidase [Elusimicrobia bacterium]|nr:carboxypeptidase [Elusimicrobiota bacterium]